MSTVGTCAAISLSQRVCGDGMQGRTVSPCSRRNTVCGTARLLTRRSPNSVFLGLRSWHLQQWQNVHADDDGVSWYGHRGKEAAGADIARVRESASSLS